MKSKEQYLKGVKPEIAKEFAKKTAEIKILREKKRVPK